MFFSRYYFKCTLQFFLACVLYVHAHMCSHACESPRLALGASLHRSPSYSVRQCLSVEPRVSVWLICLASLL